MNTINSLGSIFTATMNNIIRLKRVLMILSIYFFYVASYAQTDSTTVVNDSIKWGTILNEVVIEAHRKLIKIKGNTLIAHVANTELSNLGSAKDVLSRLPLVSTEGEKITIMGKDNVLIFVDNRPLRDNSELQMLRSENIKDVQIISSPGAEYDPEIKAVIKIQTKQSVIKGLSGKLTSRTSAKRIWEETLTGDFSYNWTHWQVFGRAMYQKDGRKNYDSNTTDFMFNNQHNLLKNTAVKHNNISSVTTQAGFNWNSNGQSLGAFYQYAQSILNFKSVGTENDYVLGIENNNISKRIELGSKSQNHLVSAYYDHIFKDGLILHFDGNYIHNLYEDNNSTHTVYESNSENEFVPSVTNRYSNLWAGKLYMELPFLTGKLNVGTEDSYTYNSQQYKILNEDISSFIPSARNESKQQYYALFSTYKKDWGSLSFQLGLRWEYVKFDYQRDGVQDENVSRINKSFSPDLSLSYKFDKGAFTALSYSHSIIRPPYKQLSSSLIYVGPFEIEGGNPMLNHCKTDVLEYLFGWRDFTLNINYSHMKDTYVYTKELYTEDRPILIFRPIQVDMNNLSAFMSYAPVIKYWKPNLTFGVTKQWLSLYGQNFNTPILRCMFKNMFTPFQNWLFTLDISGASSGHIMTNTMNAQWGIDLSVRRYLLQKQLQISISATDIFHTRNQGFIMNIKDVSLNKISNADTRSILLTLSYTFNPQKKRYKGASADTKEIKRL